jgi:hypothetical protein
MCVSNGLSCGLTVLMQTTVSRPTVSSRNAVLFTELPLDIPESNTLVSLLVIHKDRLLLEPSLIVEWLCPHILGGPNIGIHFFRSHNVLHFISPRLRLNGIQELEYLNRFGLVRHKPHTVKAWPYDACSLPTSSKNPKHLHCEPSTFLGKVI